MTVDEAKHKMDFLKKAYQKLIDEKVDSGKLVGDGVMGEWKAETPLDEAYKDMIEALDLAIKALEQKSYKSDARRWKRRYLDLKQRIFKMEERTSWIPVSERLPEDYVHVLCQFTLGGMGECYLAHGVFHVVGGLVMTCNEVIAWQPLPQRYEVESEVTE